MVGAALRAGTVALQLALAIAWLVSPPAFARETSTESEPAASEPSGNEATPAAEDPTLGPSGDDPDDVHPYRMEPGAVPSIGPRKLGEAPQREGEDVEWPHRLPFFAQQVIDDGFELPNPYGAAFVYYGQQQDVVVSDLEVSINGSPAIPIDFLKIGTSRVSNNVAQGKLDAWVLPFVNVYVTGGYVSGSVEVPLAVQGSDLADIVNPAICSGTIQPPLCSRSVSAIIEPDYEGGNITAGTVVAAGWRQFFALANCAYTWSWIDLVDTTVEAIYFSPRGGVNGDMGSLGSIQAYVGASYLLTDVKLEGSVTFDTSDSGGQLPDQTTVDFSLRQKNKDRWNFLVGANWEIKRWLGLQAEVGFGGSRSSMITSLTYRW